MRDPAGSSLSRVSLQVALALCFVSACAPRARPSGFLEDCSGFRLAQGWSGALIDRSGERPLVSTATRVITGTHLFVGEVSIEAEIMDSQSGERLVAIVDRAAGSKFNPVAGATTRGNARRALQSWAQLFRERLDASRQP